MVRPDAANVASTSGAVAAMRTDTLRPVASAIWEATVRFQMRSYRRRSLPESSRLSESGVRNESPAGRMASCASCAFFTLRA